MSKDLIIAMWSGPRNLSTALMRSFGNRADVTTVLDEPFYASYLIKTKKNHPNAFVLWSAQILIAELTHIATPILGRECTRESTISRLRAQIRVRSGQWQER